MVSVRVFTPAFCAGGGCPGGEQFESVCGGGVGVGGVDVESKLGVGGQFHAFEVEVEFADRGVAEAFAATAVKLDVVGCPVPAKQLALSR